MAHLSNSELVDSLGPDAAPAVTAHLARCERCRQRVGELHTAMDLVSKISDPEPEPGFWPLLTARVRRAVREERTSRARTRAVVGLPRWGWLMAGVSIALLAAAVVAVLDRGPAELAVPSQRAADRLLGADPGARPADDGAVLLAHDDAWARLIEAGAQVDWDAVSDSDLGLVPGEAEGAVTHLTDAERAELARLLEAALGGAPE